jgi:hypothetical protein
MRLLRALTKLYEAEIVPQENGKNDTDTKRKTKRDKANGKAKWKLKQNMEKIAKYLE